MLLITNCMKEKLEEALKKEHPSWAYSIEIGAGIVAIFADKIFDFQGSFKSGYDIATNLGGIALVIDGTRRIGNVASYYKSVIRDYLRNSQE